MGTSASSANPAADAPAIDPRRASPYLARVMKKLEILDPSRPGPSAEERAGGDRRRRDAALHGRDAEDHVRGAGHRARSDPGRRAAPHHHHRRARARRRRKTPLFLVNPEIVWSSEDERSTYEEGCLSIPDYYAEVERPAKVRVRYVDYQGKEQEREAEGLLATCVQHEIDHLNGVLFIDYLSKLKRDLVVKKFTKAAREKERQRQHRI